MKIQGFFTTEIVVRLSNICMEHAELVLQIIFPQNKERCSEKPFIQLIYA